MGGLGGQHLAPPSAAVRKWAERLRRDFALYLGKLNQRENLPQEVQRAKAGACWRALNYVFEHAPTAEEPLVSPRKGKESSAIRTDPRKMPVTFIGVLGAALSTA